MQWPKTRLGDLYEVHNGLSKPREAFGSGWPFLSYSVVFNNFFLPKTLDSLVQSTDKEQTSYSIKAGDIFVTRTSETPDELGMSCVALKDYPHATYNGFCKRLRPTTDKVHPGYIGYYLRTPEFRSRLAGLGASMITRASLRNEDLLSLTVSIPPLAIQQSIAERLARYDALIENNMRRIVILENKAQMLYKEWFVRKRGIGNVTFTAVPLFEVANISSGYPFHSDKFCADDTLNAVVRIRDIQDNDTATFTPEECDEKYLIEKNAILVGMDGLFHMCLWNGRRAYLNQRVAKITTRTTSFCNYLLFQALAPHIEYFEKTITGTTVAHLGDKHLRRVRIEIPDEKSRCRMNQPFESLMELKWNLQRQNALLTKERDLLLPRLMSGRMKP